MAYIGPEPNPGQNREVDDISSGFNGNATAFTLQVGGANVSPGSSNAIIVSLGGVVQNPGTDYTVAASTLTFTTAPASGLSFFGLVLGQGIDTQTIADGQSPIMSAPSITGDLSIADKIVHTGDTNNAIRFPAADTITAETNGSERVRIDSSGRVMIGTTVTANGDADNLHISNPGGSGDCGITIRSGDASSGNIFFSDADSGAGQFIGLLRYNHSTNIMSFNTNGSERMRIDSSGKVGINDTNPARLLSVNSSATDSYNITNATTTDALFLKNSGGNASGRNVGIQMNGGGSNGEVFLHLVGVSSTESDFYVGMRNGGERRVKVAIEHTGRLICGTNGNTANSMGGQVEIVGSIGFNDTGLAIKRINTTTTSRTFQKFVDFNGNAQGSIGMGGSTVTYNTSSDYRLKENETLISDGITRIKQLIPRRFNYKSEPEITQDGFFAHEVQAIIPEAVDGEKDAMAGETFYEEGDTIPEGKEVGMPKTYSTTKIDIQQLDYSRLTPLLTAALQEEIAKREALEIRVAALEAA